MIFFAVAGPTPGKSTNSFSLVVFKSTLAVVDWPAHSFELGTPNKSNDANIPTKNLERKFVTRLSSSLQFHSLSLQYSSRRRKHLLLLCHSSKSQAKPGAQDDVVS